ncbi:MAG: vibriolysin [Paraglaciecola sp.]|jgi:vibriolysin
MNKNKIFIISTVALSVFSATAVNAAERQNLRDNTNGLSIAAQNSPSSKINNLAQFVGLSGDNDLVVRKTYKDADGSTTIRYQQMYKGIPVVGDDVIIASDASGNFKRAHGAILQNIAADLDDVSAKISAKAAMSKAKLRSAPVGSGVLNSANNTVRYAGETSRLVIWQNDAGEATLAYEISFVQHAEKPSRPVFMIDAKTGAVLNQFDNLQTADATGPGGNEKTGQYYYGLDFAPLDVAQSGDTCTMENSNTKTVNLNHGTSGSAAYSFTCPENTYEEINGAFSPLNDAHFFGGVIFDMYNDWVGVAPLTFQLQMKVHYSNNYENAFWDGQAMTFGDGGNTFYPLVSLDVSSHEVSHGFTEQNSGLIYSNKSGGLNEAFSDIAGEAAENYMSGTNDWLVGAQIFKADGALRYMENPPLDGQSIGHQDDYNNRMDVHYSSGVYNKAFFTLATTEGWTTQKAFQVYARANQLYWTASTDWDQAGNGILDAACDLGFDVDQVQDSLVAVGVVSTSDCGTDPGVDPIDVTVTDINLNRREWSHYTVELVDGYSSLEVTTSGGTGNISLYVTFGSESTFRTFDCRPKVWGNNESCSFTAPEAGTWHIDVLGNRPSSDVTLNYKANP